MTACNDMNYLRLLDSMVYSEQTNKKIYFLLFLFNFIISHFYPLILFLTILLALILSHFLKRYKIRNYLSFFLFIFWPCCFYIYLYCFVNAVMSDGNILLQTYESPYYIEMSMESFSFWILRFSAVSTIQCPLLGFELNPVYFKQFLFETFYCLALIYDVTGLNFSIKVL
jgi:hypothetical protein